MVTQPSTEMFYCYYMSSLLIYLIFFHQYPDCGLVPFHLSVINCGHKVEVLEDLFLPIPLQVFY